jgi:hypothetical protein
MAQQLLSKLQAPRRPTSVPPSLDGSSGPAAALRNPGSKPAQEHLADASHAALAAIGVGGARDRYGDAPLMALPSPSSPSAAFRRSAETEGAPFRPNGNEAAAAAEADAARLARNVRRKLQQIDMLEQRAAGARLDAQQVAKVSQKAALLDALHVSCRFRAERDNALDCNARC